MLMENIFYRLYEYTINLISEHKLHIYSSRSYHNIYSLHFTAGN